MAYFDLPHAVVTSPGIPPGYFELPSTAYSIPGKDIYRASWGGWSVSMKASLVGTWTTYARPVALRGVAMADEKKAAKLRVAPKTKAAKLRGAA